jgi:hypothetical protein
MLKMSKKPFLKIFERRKKEIFYPSNGIFKKNYSILKC